MNGSQGWHQPWRQGFAQKWGGSGSKPDANGYIVPDNFIVPVDYAQHVADMMSSKITDDLTATFLYGEGSVVCADGSVVRGDTVWPGTAIF